MQNSYFKLSGHPAKDISSDALVSLRARVTDAQAQKLRETVTRLSFGVAYREEQHGETLFVHIQCSAPQEVSVRNLFREFGVLVDGENPGDETQETGLP